MIKPNVESFEQLTASKIFAKILYKTNFSNKKGNQKLLGIDLLKGNLKKELLVISALKVEEIYTKLLEQPNPEVFMKKGGKLLFLKCIKKSCEEFLTKQYGYQVKISLNILKKSLYTKTLLEEAELIFQLPFYVLKNPKSATFCLIFYPVYNSASESFIEALIDNIVLEISNCVVYFIIFNFSSVFVFRRTLYRSKFLSLRNFERFKNNLNWQLISKTYFQRPINIYNNRYEISILRKNGVYDRTLYANRSLELSSFSDISLLTLTFIESKDFIISRLDEIIYFVSKALRFTLTSVFGQVIGLVWRGVIEGLKK